MILNFLSINKGFGGAEKMFSKMVDALREYYPEKCGKYYNIELNTSGFISTLQSMYHLKSSTVLLNCSVLGVGLWQIILLRLLRCNVIIYPHLAINHRTLGSKLSFLRNIQMHLMLRLSDHAISISRGNDHALNKISPKTRLIKSRNFTASEPTITDIFSLNKKRFAVIGRLQEKHKGQIKILNCLAPLIDANLIQIDFFGTGPNGDEISKLIEKRGWNRNCILHGWKSEDEIFCEPFFAVINYSSWEGLPLSLLEAINHNRLVIANDIPGNSELTDENWIFSSSDQLKSIVERSLKISHNDLFSLTNNSRLDIQKEYTKEASVIQFALYFGWPIANR